jgi:hypothetical protein
MKIKIATYFLIFFTAIFYGQKKYVFDYSLEYDFQMNETSEVKKVYLLTNSKDNSYYIYAEEIENGYLNIKFKDNNGFYSKFSIKKENAFDSLSIKLNCEWVKKQNFLKENDLKRYVFQLNKDTIIQNKNYKQHTLRYKKKYDSKFYDKGFAHYVVEENTDFHMPLLLFSSSFDVALINKEIPNGIPKIIFTTNKKEDENTFIYKLASYTKITKELIFPKECFE